MARLNRPSRTQYRHRILLTGDEFASLKEVSIRPMRRTISDEHRDRLLAAGYIREVVDHSGNVYALALTGAGIRRLEAGK
jgi:hypothetical protein